MEKEVELLSRVTVNHLILGQYEPFRAAVLSLQKRNPTLALSILQTIVARGGLIEEILWSLSCPSPSNLAWLASLELLNFSRSPTSIWNIDPDALRSKVEFLLLLQLVSSRVSHPDSVDIVNRFLDFGLKRLKADIVDDDDSAPRDLVSLFTEDELQCLEKLVVDHPEIFDALSWNIQKQVKWSHTFDSRLAITLSREDQETKGSFEDNLEVLLWMQRSIQKGHINALRKCLEMNDDQGAVSHLTFLHMDYGAEESMYRIALQDYIRKACSRRNGFGDTWHSMQNKMLSIYAKAVASNSIELVQMIQVLDDQLLSEEIELHRVSDAHSIPPPLRRLQEYLQTSDSAVKGKLDDGTSPYYLAIKCCLRDMFHYARVTGVHILECVMDAALSAVKREELQEASNFLSLFPPLRPLVAVMGWDLLSGKTVLRRKLMQLLWTSKSQVLRLEDSSIYGKQSDEVSCVEHLCDLLCYRFDIASFVACANSGQSWNSKFSLLFSQGESTIKDNQMEHSDPFVENFVLERLAVQDPMRVLFDVVPGIKFRDAIELVSMQPIASKTAAWKRKQDIELMHMRYALEAVVLALGATARNSTHENENNQNLGGSYLKDLQNHLEAISSIPRKTFMLNIIIALLYMDDIYVSLTHCTPSTCNKSFSGTSSEGEGETVVSFMAQLLNILHHNLPTAGPELDKAMDSIIFFGRQALEWRISNAKLVIEDWEWRLSVLQRLLPLSARNWSWKEALAILRAAPSKLLDVCMQRAKYDIGEEAVHRFSLPPEDRAALELAEWVDSAFQKASVEDAVSRVAEGTPNAVLELDFSSFRAQLGSLPTILLCIDVAATSARSVHMCKQLLEQARVMLSEIYPGVSPKIGETYWDQIREVSLISVIKRILQCLQEFLEQENPATLQAILSGKINYSHLKEPNRQSQRQRALSILHQMIEDAHQGKRQFLSGKLHNLARALADEEMDVSFIREESMFTDKKVLPSSGKGGIFGLGFKPRRRTSVSSVRENNAEPSAYDVKDSAERLLAPISTKASTYLSAFILYIATIGDLVDGTDTTHDFNFFSVVYEWPKDLLTRLVFERGSTDAAGKVADIMSVDFVHEVVSACVPPVYPPRTGHGWASIPIQPPFLKTSVNNNLHSPKENKLTQYSDSSQTSKPPLYPLQLNVVRHLAKLSPVRAVLACVFGTSILASSNEWSLFKASNDATGQATDSDRLFYEFALDQSERFPTLNRWIQMQSNLHRVSATTLTLKDKNADDVAKPNGKLSMKRVRESDSDTESEVDDLAVNGLVSSSQLELNTQSHGDLEARHDSSKPGTVEHDQTIYLSFDWENEGPYEMAVERLINEGKLMDALALSDRCLRNGASDHLLQLLIEHGEENKSISNEGYGTNNFRTESWRLVQRLKDKQLASRLALKYLHMWDLEAATDVLTMCGCHLLENDPLKNEVLQRRQALLRYNHILCADDHCKSWQEVETECKEDPEGLALRLAGKGAVSAALEVAESAGLSLDLRRELQGRQLVKLLMTDPLSGGGPAEASRFLSSLRDTDDALPVAVSAMQLLSDLRSKQLLVHFFLKRRAGNLTDAEVSRLNKWALGLRVLGVLPLPWQQRCSALHERPNLILEVLLMRKQLQSASLVLKEFPSLRDNNLILTYAAKSITVSATSMPREQRRAVPGPRPKQKAKTGTPTRLNFTASLSNLQREARRAFSWAPRDTGNKIAPKEAYRKRKSSGLTPSEKVAWEAMTGIQEERISVCSADGQERIPSLSIAEEWMLTGDLVKDNSVRSSHRYESSPDIILFKVLLSLCSDESVSAKGALDLCISQMKNILSSQQLPLHASLETLGRACHATETFVQGLQYAKSLLRKVGGNSNSTSSSDKSKDTDEASSDAGSSSIGSCSQYSDELHELLSQVEIWLGRAELLQSLLGSGIVASIDDIGDKESSARLRDRLIEDERYSMAVYTCKKCKIDAFPVWNAWGHALLRMEHYAQARVKFKQALQLYKGDFTPIIMEIINTIEGSPPVDVDAVRSMCEDLAKSAPRILDDSLSADAYLNVLYVPSTYPRSEPSGQSRSATNFQSASYLDFDVGPRSNLDNIRYTECVTYLQDFARQQVLGFMFRHGHYSDACMLFFPSSGAPSSPQPSSLGAVTPSPSPQRSDPLTTDYGTIDDLCEHCIGYGAVSVLENVISSRLASQDPIVIQYTTSALARICNYCETHRHFNHLYKFQVIKKDHVAAGLCCIQLFMNSSSQEEAIKHLELAKMHFEEGLSARHKSGDTMKLSSKSIRGKSALTEEGLMKFSARVAIQVEVVKSFHDTDGPQWKHSLFGNPSDPDTFRRRCEVAETLAEKNFDLAFQVIYEFNLPAVDIYAGVAASLAERKKGGQLTEFFRNIKGTIDDDDWDQVLGAAINVYANRHKERPDRLIDMLISSHRKVLACVVCGRLKSAFQIASRSGSVADVQYVAHQALHANALPVLDMCKQWLAQFM